MSYKIFLDGIEQVPKSNAINVQYDNSTSGLIAENVQDAIDEKMALDDTIRNDSKEKTGFTEPENVIVTYDSTTRKITLTGTVKAYWRDRVVPSLVSGWISEAHANTPGNYFLYYNGSAFVWSTTIWTFDMLMIAYVQFNGNDLALRECHGLMDWRTHEELHDNFGTYLKSGGDISGITLNSTTAGQRRPDISAANVLDEDLKSTITALTSKTYTQRYLTGVGVRTFTTGASDIVSLLGNQPYYNRFTGGTWQQTLFSNNHYGAIFVVAVPVTADAGSQVFRFMFVQPQTTSATLSVIQALTPQNLTHGDSTSIVSEFVFIGKIIIRYTASNWTIISVEKLTGTKASQISTQAGTFLTEVITNTSLTGNGTTASPLAVSTDYVTKTGTETLTNKTLTSPVINTTATGTGVTTTGEASKVVKTDTLGDIYERGNRVAEDFKANSNKPSVFLNGTNAWISIPDNDNLDFGTGTFSIITEHLFESGNTQRVKVRKYLSSAGFTLEHSMTNKIALFIGDGTNIWNITSTNSITDGKFHVIGFVCGVDSASSKLYIDGVEDTTAGKTGTFPTLTKSNVASLFIGSTNGTFHKTETRFNRIFNYALTASQFQKYSYDGIAYEDVGASNAKLLINGDFETGTNTDVWITNGATAIYNDTDVDRTGLYNAKITATGISANRGVYIEKGIAGKRMRIKFRAKANINTAFRVGANGSPIVSSITTTMTEYTYEFIGDGIVVLYMNATSIGDWFVLDDVSITQIGAVLDLTSDSIANTGWFDKSGNKLHATYTNAIPFNLQNYKPRIQGYSADMRGANVASATTITPTGELFHVTGTTAIATINVPYAGFNGSITIIPDGIFTWTTAGNIALAGTAVVSKALRMTYDATTSKWYPDYTS